MAEGDQFFLASSTTGERIELTGEMSVGRSNECDIVLSEGQPSREHAKITIEGSAVFVEDLKSTNGTFVNGTQLTAKQQLNHGDELAFDVNKFRLNVQNSDATVLREVDSDKTVFRPVIKEPAEPAPPAPPVAAAPPETTSPPVEAPVPDPAPPPAVEAVIPEPAPPEPEAPVQAAPAEPAPPAKAPPPTPEPVAAAPAAAEAKPKPVKPGSWADPNEKNASSTAFFSPEDLAQMRGGSVAEKVESDVPYLQVTSGSAAGSIIQLIAEGSGKKEWTIGSDAGRDIVFADQGVSEFHTLLVHESGRWKLVDQMSTNGTFINDSKTVTGYLNTGDSIRIGTVKGSFVLPGAAGAAAKSRSGGGSGSKVWVSVASFIAVLAVLFGAYFLL